VLILLKNLGKFGLTGPRLFLLTAISILAAVFEGFGMAMFLPLMEYIEKGKDVSVLIQGSNLWKRLVSAFDYLGLEVSLVSLIVAVLILMILRIVSMYIRRVYTVWLSQDTLHRIRTKIFSAYLCSNYSFYSTVSTGHKINLINIEAPRTVGALTSLFEMVSNVFVIAGFVVLLLWVSVPMTAFAALFLAVAGVVVTYYVRHTKKLGRLMTISNEKLSFLLIERLTAFRLIKLTGSTKREIQNIDGASQKVRNYNYWSQKINARVDLLLEPMVVAGALSVIYFSVTYFHMSLSMLGLFILILIRLLPLCKEVLRSRQSFLAQLGAVEAINSGLRDAENAPEMGEGKRSFKDLESEIRFRDLTFTYDGQSRPALRDVSVVFKAGEMTALVGPSGAGKSTLVDLIPRLRIPQKGEILFDGDPAETFQLASLRRAMAFVSQDAFMFNDTVFANIAFGHLDVPEHDVWEVLKKARAEEFVKTLPQGLSTVLGERGVRLSGGQRQRLSLARAFLQNAPILILDEPTSSLDSEVEKDIQKAINTMRKERKVTIIVIAHRLSTIQGADKIIVLDGGRVVEKGTHHQLLVSKEWYYRVSGMQAGVKS
jgi:ABC-type multidrug transport system fused ATPase/permease subunit